MHALQQSSRLWQSHLDARDAGMMPPPPAPTTDTGREMSKRVLEQARAMSARLSRPAASRQPVASLTSWKDTPYEHRRMLAFMAQLPLSVADKSDRELTEPEKAILRAAAQRVAQGISGLAASL